MLPHRLRRDPLRAARLPGVIDSADLQGERLPRIPRETRNTPDVGPRLHGFQRIPRSRAVARPPRLTRPAISHYYRITTPPGVFTISRLTQKAHADFADSADFRRLAVGFRRLFVDYTDLQGKGSHGFHGKHETRLTWGCDFTDSNGFHGAGPLRDPHA